MVSIAAAMSSSEYISDSTLCVFSDDPVPVSALQLFLVAHGDRGDPVFCTCVPEGDGEDRGNAELTGGVEREMILVWMAGRWVIERA